MGGSSEEWQHLIGPGTGLVSTALLASLCMGEKHSLRPRLLAGGSQDPVPVPSVSQGEGTTEEMPGLVVFCNPQGQSPPSMGVQASAGPQAGPFQAGGQEPLQGLEPAVGGRAGGGPVSVGLASSLIRWDQPPLPHSQ